MKPDRTLVLAAIAGALVVGFAIDLLVGGGGTTAAPANDDPAGVARIVTAAPVGAPRGLDAAGLQERYALVVEADPFEVRSFKPQPRASRRPTPRVERPGPTAPPPPEKLELRLTGLLGQGEGRVGILEDRASGKGILAHPGLELGELSVASVDTGSITLAEDGSRRELQLGDELLLPKELSRLLVVLKTTTSGSAAAASSRRPGSTPAVEVSDDERQKILERLRQRRRRSVGGGQEGDSQ